MSPKSQQLIFLIQEDKEKEQEFPRYKFVKVSVDEMYDDQNFLEYEQNNPPDTNQNEPQKPAYTNPKRDAYEQNTSKELQRYEDKQRGIFFEYPASWGTVFESTSSYSTLISFSNMPDSEHIRLTTIDQFRAYLKDLREMGSKEQPVAGGPGGAQVEWGLKDYPKELPIHLYGLSYNLDYLSLLNPAQTPDDKTELAETIEQIHVFFADNPSALVKKMLVVNANQNQTLVGASFMVAEGFVDDGDIQYIESAGLPLYHLSIGSGVEQRYVESILTSSLKGETMLIVRIPIHEVKTYEMPDDNYEEAYKRTEELEARLSAEWVNLIKSISLASAEPRAITNEQRAIALRDLKKKRDLFEIVEALNSYFLKYRSYPKVEPIEKLTPSNLTITELYKEMHKDGWINISDPWDFTVPQDEYFGYLSNGAEYELTAILWNTGDHECVLEGAYCVYRIKNGEVVSLKQGAKKYGNITYDTDYLKKIEQENAQSTQLP